MKRKAVYSYCFIISKCYNFKFYHALNTIKSNCKTFVRDFNARMARELGYLEDQGANDHITEDIYDHGGFNLPRSNKDTEKNNYGEEL